MTIETDSNDAAAVINSTEELTLAAAGLTELHGDDQVYPHIFTQTRRKADGSWELATLDAESWANAPRRKRGRIRVASTESLASYVNLHATTGTTLYANADGITVEAILDDHAGDGPHHRDHRVTLTLIRTPGCERWLDAHAKYLEQEAFAQLIEDGLAEIARPDGATLLEVAQSIRATKSAAFRSDKRLTTGRVQFQWVEDVTATAGADGNLEIPEMVTLVFEPFYGAEKVQVDARFRYRIRDGKLHLGFWLVRHEEALRDAFAAELARLRGLLDVDALILDGSSS